MELELVKFTRALAEAKTADGKIVQIGYKKSANILLELANKPIGHKFDLAVEVSDKGHLYNAETLDLQEAYFRAESMNKRRAILDKQLAAFEEL